ncbi:Uncharacterised protein r2_g4106 [Pycnogonum litorale]
MDHQPTEVFIITQPIKEDAPSQHPKNKTPWPRVRQGPTPKVPKEPQRRVKVFLVKILSLDDSPNIAEAHPSTIAWKSRSPAGDHKMGTHQFNCHAREIGTEQLSEYRDPVPNQRFLPKFTNPEVFDEPIPRSPITDRVLRPANQADNDIYGGYFSVQTYGEQAGIGFSPPTWRRMIRKYDIMPPPPIKPPLKVTHESGDRRRNTRHYGRWKYVHTRAIPNSTSDWLVKINW